MDIYALSSTSYLWKMSKQWYTLYCFTKTHLVSQNAVDALPEKTQNTI